ncbi:MAG: adenylate/guanylate cyclase domain-containing protein [Pseudomonadota bacterium]|nr:adenylate/guanylate cyclase domain-containing protein [Pseudomonadota bacterium]
MTLPDNFAKRYLARFIGVLGASGLILLSLWNPSFINNLRLKAYDVLLREQSAPATIEQKIIIVDIDDRSLAELGQWPWPRSLWAEIISRVGRNKPLAIGLDIVFAEPDRSSPHQIATSLKDFNLSTSCQEQLLELPDNDQILAKSLENYPVVLGFPFSFSHSDIVVPPVSQRLNRFALMGKNNPDAWLFQARSAAFNLTRLETAAIGSGFFNVLADDDGIIRRVPLALQYGERIFPSLVLEMLRISERTALNRIYTASSGLEGISCGAYEIPTDAHGQINVHYSGPEKSFTYISAVDIMTSKVNGQIFAGNYVIIGTSAPGLVDIVTTPVSAMSPGVEVHAHALNTILAGSWLREPDWAGGAEFIYLLLISTVLIILVPAIGALRGGLVFIVGAAGISGFSYWLFSRHGYYLDAVYPLLCSTLLFSLLSFMNYFLEERVRQQTKKTFSKYISPDLVEELLKTPGKVNLKGEERVLTAIFSDIRNFSRMSEILSPEAICTTLNQYLTVMTKILMDNRGTVDKFIGDAIFAFWNAPLYDTEHARHALTATLAMRDGLIELNQSWPARNMPTLKVGIGVHTGPVQIGNIGSENRLSYTAIGDNVNLTSRLEGVTKQYGVPIIVSASTWEMVDKNEFVFCKLDCIRVVGRQEPVTIYELVDHKARVSARRLALIKAYEEALEIYFKGDFAQAKEKFQQLPEGSYSRLQEIFMTRCHNHLARPETAAWDGVNTLEDK